MAMSKKCVVGGGGDGSGRDRVIIIKINLRW